MSNTTVFIPYRQQESDDLRPSANLDVTMAWWYGHGYNPEIIDDGQEEGSPLHPYRAYNRAREMFPDEEVYVFAELGTLVHPEHVNEGIKMAKDKLGLVVPFCDNRVLPDSVTAFVRNAYTDMDTRELAEWWALPSTDPISIFDLRAEEERNRKVVDGMVIASADTLNAVGGFTEATTGADLTVDGAVADLAYSLVTRRTRWLKAPAVRMDSGYPAPAPSEDDNDILNAMARLSQLKDKTGTKRLMTYRYRQAASA